MVQRHDWSLTELRDIHDMPLLELVFRAATVHRKHHDPRKVQVSSLLSVKTGGCPEDCAYCPQAARYNTDVDVHKMLDPRIVVARAKKAKEAGASRMCLGAAWREVRDNRDFDKVIDMVKGIRELNMEVCCTLGMLNEEQAKKLDEAGVYAYNHNIDTSEEHYEEIISTRTFDDRLDTLKHVRKTNMTICSGGIIGMGESIEDRLGMLRTLSGLAPHPESVPINALVPVEGTPLAAQERVPFDQWLRMIATARIVMPTSMVRLSAGRTELGEAEHALLFLAGANSIFAGDQLLTTPNPEFSFDQALLNKLGLEPQEAYAHAPEHA
ncbi:MAG: biotin synthase BioB [Flavobacteriales bacterium]